MFTITQLLTLDRCNAGRDGAVEISREEATSLAGLGLIVTEEIGLDDEVLARITVGGQFALEENRPRLDDYLIPGRR